MDAKTPPGRIPAGRSNTVVGDTMVVKDATKIWKICRLAKFPISFCFAWAFHDTRTHKWRGPVVPLGLLWDKLCRFGPIGSRPALYELA